MDKFALVIGKADLPIADTFDLVIGPADIERVENLREAVGECRLPSVALGARVFDTRMARADARLRPISIGGEGVDQKKGLGAVRLYPLGIGARSVETKPDRTAIGHVFLREPVVASRIVDPIDGVGDAALWPVEIGGRAEFGAEAGGDIWLWPVEIRARAIDREAPNPNRDAAGDIRLHRLEIGARTAYEAPASGCVLVSCSMTGRALIRRFRELAQDEVEPYLWEDCFVLNMLNEAEREAADRAKLLYDDSPAVAVAVKAGKARYAIDPHIIDIERAALTAKGDGRPPLLLKLFDRMELDWKTPPRSKHEAGSPWGRPFGLVFDGRHDVEIVPGPGRNGRLLLGVHRLPWATFDLDDTPEIPCIHHAALVDWALFRAFSIPDADEANEQLAAFYHDRFEKYFGRRIDARKRRTQRANKPHVNKLW